MFNDLTGKESARIATVYGQTACNQGCLLNSKKLHRGKGFEATTQLPCRTYPKAIASSLTNKFSHARS
ncbi:type VI secretion system Vgr family protein [Caballeronia fortuita]|uniref:type VI secretion system Vgr family protein n=1 Tax=Caballeronia fortuita TaxID=1777138 RepID=UPI002446735C|nr:type VI secretion system Vgr family protein [Caballeronia fortuita]